MTRSIYDYPDEEPWVDLSEELGFEYGAACVLWTEAQLIKHPKKYNNMGTIEWCHIIFEKFTDSYLNPEKDFAYTIAHRIVIEAASDLTVKGYGIYCFDPGDAEWQWVNTSSVIEPYNSQYKNRELIKKIREEQRIEYERESGETYVPFDIPEL